MTQSIDSARLTLLLNELRLPTIKVNWPDLARQADKEGWPAARFLATRGGLKNLHSGISGFSV